MNIVYETKKIKKKSRKNTKKIGLIENQLVINCLRNQIHFVILPYGADPQ